MKTCEVVALGELLIDFTQNGMSSQNNPMYEANPGGAPCNVLAMLQNLGISTAFIGKVGKDQFGELLKGRVADRGIDITGLYEDVNSPTTLAFVKKNENGDRDFSFYRDHGADVMLTSKEVMANSELIENTKIFHFGSLSMTASPCTEATKTAIEIAKKSGSLLSFDPNYREPLWDSVDHAKEAIEYGFSKCDILKISDNEIELMTGESDIDAGIEKIIGKYNIPLVFATLGENGSKAFYKNLKVYDKGIRSDKTIETTGAGDTFCACALSFVLKYGIDNLNEERLSELLHFANTAACIITTRRGALSVMPTREEIKQYLQ